MNTLRRSGRRRRLALLSAAIATVVAVFATTSLPAFSGDNGTISASVTAQSPACVTLGETTRDFGTLSFADTTNVQARNPTTTIQNCGGQSEKLFGKGTDATNAAGSVTWTLDSSGALPCSLGPNKFNLIGGVDANAQYLSKTDQQLDTLPQGTSTLRVGLRMPCTGSGGAGQTMSWQYIYTVTL